MNNIIIVLIVTFSVLLYMFYHMSNRQKHEKRIVLYARPNFPRHSNPRIHHKQRDNVYYIKRIHNGKRHRRH